MLRNEKQRELVILLAIITGFIATILIGRYDNFTVLWVLYNIPAYLMMIAFPTWRVAGTIIGCILASKMFMTITSGQVLDRIDIMEMAIGSISNIVLFLTVAYFIVKFKQNTVEKLEELEMIVETDKKE